MTLDKEIRNKCKELILLGESAATTNPAEAVVYPFDSLSLKPEEWANLFAKSSVYHGWVIKRTATASIEIRSNIFADTFTYDIWGFYQFKGTAETNNSDDVFQEILDKITDQFKLKMTLDLNCVKEHKIPQFTNITVIPSGKTALHFAQGKLTVELCAKAVGGSCS